MKGILFNTVEETVGELFGPDTWDDLIEAADVSGSYTALGTYPDAELFAIVGAACKALELPADDVLRTLGQHSFKRLASHVNELVEKDKGVFHFLSTVHDIIHVEVAKLVPDANTPVVKTSPIDDSSIKVTYSSERNIPALAHGLILGAGDYFEEPLDVELTSHEGNDAEFLVTKG